MDMAVWDAVGKLPEFTLPALADATACAVEPRDLRLRAGGYYYLARI